MCKWVVCSTGEAKKKQEATEKKDRISLGTATGVCRPLGVDGGGGGGG